MAAATVQQPNVTDYLAKKQKESPKDLAAEWAELEELHNKRFATEISTFSGRFHCLFRS